IVKVAEDGRVTVADVTTGKVKAQFGPQGNGTKDLSAAFSPDGKRIALGGSIPAREGKGEDAKNIEAGTFTVLTADLKEIISSMNDTSPIIALAFSPDGKRVAAGCKDGRIRVRDAETGTTLISPGWRQDAEIVAVAFSPDGKVLLEAGADKSVKLWD